MGKVSKNLPHIQASVPTCPNYVYIPYLHHGFCCFFPYERSAKPQLKNAISGQSYRFWSSLYRFTVNPDCIICASPGKLRAESLFTPPLQRLKHLWTALRFLLQRSNCMVWYDTCQCNCKSQLHRPVSNSETSLNSVVGRSLDELSQRHAPCLSFTPQRLGSKPSHGPWSNKIVKPQLSDWWQLSTKSSHVCNPAKSMRSSENTECSRAP